MRGTPFEADRRPERRQVSAPRAVYIVVQVLRRATIAEGIEDELRRVNAAGQSGESPGR